MHKNNWFFNDSTALVCFSGESMVILIDNFFFFLLECSGGSSPLGSSPSPTSPSAAMHPISLSLLHSSSSASSHHSFYGSSASTIAGSSASTVASPSPLKRSRHQQHLNNNNNAMEEWLPSPGQMSVDSMSPPPPPSSSSMSMRGADGPATNLSNGHSTLPPSVISSSNGYSPSPMSTGSYEPPFSPGGGGKLGQYQNVFLSVRPSSSFFFFLLAVGLGEIRALDCTDRSSRSRPLSKVSFLFLAGLHTFISLRVESACVCVDKASIGGHDHVPVPSEKRGTHTKKKSSSFSPLADNRI